MSTINKTISKVVASSGTWTVTLSDVEGVQVGMQGDIQGLATPAWNADNVTIDAVDTTNLTITYDHGNFTVTTTTVWGQFHLNIEWITAQYVKSLLGYEPSVADGIYLDECIDAAENYAWRRRQESGYTTDHPNVYPTPDVRLGTALYAMALFKERGSVDTFSTFQDAPTVGMLGSMGQINRLLGINRSQVA